MTTLLRVALASAATVLMGGCAGVAKITDFPRSANAIDFAVVQAKDYSIPDAVWNLKTEFDHFVEVRNSTEQRLFEAAAEALRKEGYTVSFSDLAARTVIAERGLGLAEWSSISAVYYKGADGMFKVYVKNAITQDITGSWRVNRAQEVAVALCKLVECNASMAAPASK